MNQAGGVSSGSSSSSSSSSSSGPMMYGYLFNPEYDNKSPAEAIREMFARTGGAEAMANRLLHGWHASGYFSGYGSKYNPKYRESSGSTICIAHKNYYNNYNPSNDSKGTRNNIGVPICIDNVNKSPKENQKHKNHCCVNYAVSFF